MKLIYSKFAAVLALTISAALPATAATFSFSAVLAGTNENPANGSNATGTALVTFDDVLNNVTVNVTFSGLTTNATAGHIHCCSAPSANAGVAMGFTSFPASTSANYNAVLTAFNGANTFTSLLDGANAGLAYVNLHNTTFPGGEIRGNLAAVPEASTYAMMLAGLVGVGAVARRRRLQN